MKKKQDIYDLEDIIYTLINIGNSDDPITEYFYTLKEIKDYFLTKWDKKIGKKIIEVIQKIKPGETQEIDLYNAGYGCILFISYINKDDTIKDL